MSSTFSGSASPNEAIDPATYQAHGQTTSVGDLLDADGIRFLITPAIRNFSGFTPVGVILVAMVGLGLVEEAGLIGALIRKIVLVAPPKSITFTSTSPSCRASPSVSHASS